MERAIALYDPKQHRSIALFGMDPWTMSSGMLSWSEQVLGRTDRALRRSRAAVARARKEASRPFDLAVALGMAASVHQFRREREPTRELAQASISLSAEFPEMLGIGFWTLGWALCELGRVEDGIVEIVDGISCYRSTGATLFTSWPLGLLAWAHAKAGRIEQALSTLTEAFEVVEKNGERFYEAELVRLKGEVLQQRPAAEEGAEACFREAIEIARRQNAKTWELRATTSLSRLLQSHGQREEAHRTLGETLAWFTEGFDAPDLKDAKALLEELS